MNAADGVVAANEGRLKKDRLKKRMMSVRTVVQDKESIEPESINRTKWSLIYDMFTETSEAGQLEVFGAVNLFFLANGTSPKAKWKRDVKTPGGKEVPAAEIVKIIGTQEGELRQFMRGRMEESYLFLKNNPGVREDMYVAEKAAKHNVPADEAWLMADWLSDCPFFVSDESSKYERIKTHNLRSAVRQSLVGVPPTITLAEEEDRVYDIPAVTPSVSQRPYY